MIKIIKEVDIMEAFDEYEFNPPRILFKAYEAGKSKQLESYIRRRYPMGAYLEDVDSLLQAHQFEIADELGLDSETEEL